MWDDMLLLILICISLMKWQPTPVFLRGESQGRGSLVGCRLRGRRELDTTGRSSSSSTVLWSSHKLDKGPEEKWSFQDLSGKASMWQSQLRHGSSDSTSGLFPPQYDGWSSEVPEFERVDGVKADTPAVVVWGWAGWLGARRRQIHSVCPWSVIGRCALFEQKYFVKGSDSNMYWSLNISWAVLDALDAEDKDE